MSETSERLERLERETRVLRRWVFALGAILAGCVTVGLRRTPRGALSVPRPLDW